MNTSKSSQLTKYPVASLRELFTLAFPLILAALSTSLLMLCDRKFLTHYSQNAWKSSSVAINLCSFFQLGLTMVAFVSQAFVGHYKGAKQDKKIGPFIWQMVYFSFLSMLITYPLSFVSETYLRGIEVEKDAILYFRILSAANFLYPLGATLASFYMGRGKNRVVLMANLVIQGVNIVLDYLLIFGVDGIIPPLGVKGAAIATVIAQSTYCLILLFFFQQKKNRVSYAVHKWRFNRSLFVEGLEKGLPRALGKTMAVVIWLLASHLLVHKGGDYLLIHTFGVSLFLPLLFIGDGMGQALLTINSHSLGKPPPHPFAQTLRTSLYFVSITAIILAIPLLFMKETIIHFFIKEPVSEQSYLLLKECCVWVWIACIGSAVNRIGVSMITASRDTGFYAMCVSIAWITLFIPVFVGIGKLGWLPPKFFLIEGLSTFLVGVTCIIRFFKEPYKQLGPQSIRINLIN